MRRQAVKSCTAAADAYFAEVRKANLSDLVWQMAKILVASARWHEKSP